MVIVGRLHLVTDARAGRDVPGTVAAALKGGVDTVQLRVEDDLTDRLAYDPERNILFLNFEGLHVRRLADVEAIREAVAALCGQIGRRVAVVVNYDAFRLDPDVADAYAEMVRSLEDTFYTRVSRYTTSAFMRVKLGQVLTRTVRPHIFESKSEAQSFHESVGEG